MEDQQIEVNVILSTLRIKNYSKFLEKIVENEIRTKLECKP